MKTVLEIILKLTSGTLNNTFFAKLYMLQTTCVRSHKYHARTVEVQRRKLKPQRTTKLRMCDPSNCINIHQGMTLKFVTAI